MNGCLDQEFRLVRAYPVDTELLEGGDLLRAFFVPAHDTQIS
jgi:hypothetical protein